MSIVEMAQELNKAVDNRWDYKERKDFYGYLTWKAICNDINKRFDAEMRIRVTGSETLRWALKI